MARAPALRPHPDATERLTFPVVEIFGPTIQGEGPDAGRPAYFVRFGGCDYRCSWCDSMHAVDPAEVRAHAEHLTADEITERLAGLPAGPDLVVISGGNPALLDLTSLVVALRAVDLEIAVETQGSRWRDWLAEVDRLVVSPKPPSSGMDGPRAEEALLSFMDRAMLLATRPVLKVVVFDQADLDWAEVTGQRFPDAPLFLSAGTDVGLSDDETICRLRKRYRWLAEAVACRPRLARASVFPQLHVVAWGTARGV
jgi:7-carboxy-7-deazaguanine synthase